MKKIVAVAALACGILSTGLFAEEVAAAKGQAYHFQAKRLLNKHDEVLALKGKTVGLVMIGDSITDFWESFHRDAWKKFNSGRLALNIGYAGDLTQHAIWRLEHGELDGYKAKVVTIMIGTNNNTSDKSKPEDVAEGVKKIVSIVREKQPQAKIILHAIFPRGGSAESDHARARARNDKTNALLKEFVAKDGKIVWLDLTKELTDETGWVPKDIMEDYLHPTAKGYQVWARALKPLL